MASEVDSDSDQELYPVEFQACNESFLYEDPLLVTGVLRAVVEGDLDKVKKLIQGGKSANINDNHGNTPLHVAVVRNLSEIVDYLLTLDEVMVNCRNFYGETALLLAVKQGNFNLVQTLIKANANVNLPNFEDITPLHLSVKYPNIAFLLIENGAKINVVDYSGETPLHEAVNESCVETICMLLYVNADANVGCDNNITPFMKSIILENVEIQGILLDYVVDFNTSTNEGMTILNLALTHMCPYVEEIVERGADVNYKHKVLNAFLMCLQVPDADKFSLIWKNFNYQMLYSASSYLEQLIHNLDNNDIFKYLQIIINSNNLAPIFESFDFTPFYNFLKGRVHNRQYWSQIAYDLVYLYLCDGNMLRSTTICQLYELYGYNDVFYPCLHMDIEEANAVNRSMALIFYHTRLRMEYFKSLAFIWIYHDESITIKQFLPYIRIGKASVPGDADEWKRDLDRLSEIPSLLELARNKTRDYMIHKFGLFSSKKYHLFVCNLPIATVYKDILTFKKPIYLLKN